MIQLVESLWLNLSTFLQNPHTWHQIGYLALLAVISFVQNMCFTWTSRSRNSGDPDYHRYASWCSNGVWMGCQLLITKQVYAAFEKEGEWRWLIPMAIVYIIATTEGSVLMMRILLKKETGKRAVGAK
jgi:hypothetical protein